VWRRDGRELYFAGSSNQIVAVPIRGGDTLVAQGPAPLVPTALTAFWTLEAQMSLDVSPDGQRFVVATDDSPSPVRSLTLIQQWPALIRAR
jgi:hypothetical protein